MKANLKKLNLIKQQFKLFKNAVGPNSEFRIIIYENSQFDTKSIIRDIIEWKMLGIYNKNNQPCAHLKWQFQIWNDERTTMIVLESIDSLHPFSVTINFDNTLK